MQESLWNNKNFVYSLGFVLIVIGLAGFFLRNELTSLFKEIFNLKSVGQPGISAASHADIVYNPNSSKEEKITALKSAKEVLDSTTSSYVDKSDALKLLTNVSFDYGTTLSDGVSSSGKFDERELYELGKKVYGLKDAAGNFPIRASLTNLYIGLRFYPREVTQENVDAVLANYLKLKNTAYNDNPCGNANKYSSLLYLAQKNSFKLQPAYGNFNDSFNVTFNSICKEEKKSTVAFMWLGAISDMNSFTATPTVSSTTITILLHTISSKANDSNDRLVQNLKLSYFSEPKEPDTKSIVERLMATYPEFKSYIDILSNK